MNNQKHDTHEGTQKARKNQEKGRVGASNKDGLNEVNPSSLV